MVSKNTYLASKAILLKIVKFYALNFAKMGKVFERSGKAANRSGSFRIKAGLECLVCNCPMHLRL